ncbi:uncharacterized protein LOC110729788 [Chenopodium quinoa]|uniref:uncharacterized protein LOC110729788 n=1 Tax=Chenopodium quinoa TaxID=63459 RepID=UPI000B78FCFD|nr:uncharacterized protein LOC110729788 [Chenopodium quinoa]
MILGPQMIEDTVIKVKEIQAVQDPQKSYEDLKHREEKFEVGDKVLLKVSPMKGVMRFGKKGNLSLKYIGPYESHVLQPEAIELDQSLTYEERPVKILDKYEEATWEAEDEMKKKYPELFEAKV